MMLAPNEAAAGPRSYVHAFVLSVSPAKAELNDWLAGALRTAMSARYKLPEGVVEVAWDENPPTFTDNRFSQPLPSVGLGVASPSAFQERNWVDAMICDVQTQFSKQFPHESLFFLARHLHYNPNSSTTLVDSMLIFPRLPGIGGWVREPISWKYMEPILGEGGWAPAWNHQSGLDAAFRILLDRHLGGSWDPILSQHRQRALESSLPVGEVSPGRSPRF